MNIFLDDKAEAIKKELKNKGYNIIKDNSAACDAVICDLKNCDFNSLNSQINLKREGALIIDCGNKSAEDIDNILNNRGYNTSF